MSEKGSSNGGSKTILAVAGTLLISAAGAMGTAIYKHELAILANARHVEQLKIKDYRQHRDSLRTQVRVFGDAANVLEAVLEVDEQAFGPNGRLILKQRKEQLRESISRLENYVEENKHGGRGD